MQIKQVQFKTAQIGKIYVTRGGTVQDETGTIHAWGYERVKLIKKDEKRYLYTFETPWGTQLEVSGDYELFTTPETTVRSAHPMVGLHDLTTVRYIPFDQAVNEGICAIMRNTPFSPNSDDTAQNFDINGFKRALIEYFKMPREIAQAARHFHMQYPRIRSFIKTIIKSGIDGQHYTAIEGTSENGKKTIQLKKNGLWES